MSTAAGSESSRLAERLLVDHQAILRDLAQARPGARIAADIAELVRRHTDALAAVLVLTPPEEAPVMVIARSTPDEVRAALETHLVRPGDVATMPIRQGAGPVEPTQDPGLRSIAEPLIAAGVGAVWRSSLHDARSRRTGALILLFDSPRTARGHEQLAVDLTSDLVALLAERATAGELSEFQVRVDDRRFGDEDRLEGILSRHVGRGGQVGVAMVAIGQHVFSRAELDGETGDALMAMVLRRVRRGLDPGATLVRVDIDAFAVVIPRIEQYELYSHLMTRLGDALEEPFTVMGRSVRARLAVGAASEATGPSGAVPLARAARSALAHARALPVDSAVRIVLDLPDAPTDLDDAAALEVGPVAGEWTVRLQPIVHLGSGAVIGAEALLYWQDDVRGTMPAEHLLDDRRSPENEPLEGGWTLEQALGTFARLRGEGLLAEEFQVVIAVADGFLDADVAVRVADLLARHDWPAAQVMLELCPRRCSLLGESTRAALDGLRSLGVRFALGGFGVDAASIRHLEDLHIDAVRIDHSLVGSLRADGSGSPLAAWAIRMARERDRITIATGVEAEEQARGLQRLGCVGAQGHHLAPPSDESAFRMLLGGRPTEPVDVQQTVANS